MNEDRTPPHDAGAEQAVLGGMLMHRNAIEEVADLLTGGSFYLPKHERVFDAITALDARDEPADPVTVAAELTRRGELAKIGGLGYLHELTQAVPTAANAGYYAEIVREYAVRRRLIEIGTRYVQMGYDTTEHTDLAQIIDEAQAMAMTLDHTEQDEEDLSLASAYIEVLESAEHGISKGLPTGLRDFDELTGGLHPGQLVVVAARPALGKSVVAENWVRHTAIQSGRPAAMFSLEMSRFEIAKRAIAAEGAIPLHHIAPGKMTDTDWDRVNNRTKTIPAAPLYVDENPNQTINSIRSKARRMVRKHHIELLAVDYLQLMEAEAKRRGSGDNRQQDVSAISRGLKLLAKELQIPVIAVAQLNRGPETRADKKPQMSDLRESGSIENDADLVILIHREAAYEEESPRAGEADLIVAKHRGGPKATLTVAFQGHYARFKDMGGA